MSSGVVQFREDEATLEALRLAGINPNEFGRRAFEEAFRRFTTDRKMKFLSEVRERIRRRAGHAGVSKVDFVALVRRDRESH